MRAALWWSVQIEAKFDKCLKEIKHMLTRSSSEKSLNGKRRFYFDNKYN